MIRISRRSALAAPLLGMLLTAAAACSSEPQDGVAPVTVFAAASLTDALTELAGLWRAKTGQEVRLSFAASGQIARQVEAGAPADMVILADETWMDRLAAAHRINLDSRLDLLGNRLVLIASPEARIEGDPLTWLKRTHGKLVIGDPDSVPAGAYARDWLKGRGQWDGLQSALVTAADVRAVRGFVARGEARLGVVYRSDATGVGTVRVVLEPPVAEQPAIVYPAAMIAGAPDASKSFLRWLPTAEAGAVFRRHGFEPLS
jgi:molybdate transport system substrate-binding protein